MTNWERGGAGEEQEEEEGRRWDWVAVVEAEGGGASGLRRGSAQRGAKVFVHGLSLLPSELHPHLGSSSP